MSRTSMHSRPSPWMAASMTVAFAALFVSLGGIGSAAKPELFIPSGTVSAFNLSACPAGWTEFTAAQGRYIVGLPSGGTLAGTAGTALSDRENRAVGQHNHSVTDPGHTHLTSIPAGLADSSTAGQFGGFDIATDLQGFSSATSDSSTTGISVNNAGSVAGTNAPYIQLLLCQKS